MKIQQKKQNSSTCRIYYYCIISGVKWLQCNVRCQMKTKENLQTYLFIRDDLYFMSCTIHTFLRSNNPYGVWSVSWHGDLSCSLQLQLLQGLASFTKDKFVVFARNANFNIGLKTKQKYCNQPPWSIHGGKTEPSVHTSGVSVLSKG